MRKFQVVGGTDNNQLRPMTQLAVSEAAAAVAKAMQALEAARVLAGINKESK